MNRIVEPEWLDTLPPEDPRATASRRDLQRVNWWMGNHAIMARALTTSRPASPPRHITELGAGDGRFLLPVAPRISPRWPGVNVTLLDRQPAVSAETLAAFRQLGWPAETMVADVFNWPPADGDIVIANLFLHHFEQARLTELLGLISRRAKLFIGLEPRRARWPLFCSHLLWVLGCNEVTRHDAVVSVRAGFSGNELSTSWPDEPGWHLTEQSAGAFGHLFIASRTE